MKLLITILSLTFIGNIAFAGLTSQETKEVTINISDALVPSTVEAGNKLKAVISGMFPNGCYSYNRATVDKSSQDGIIRVRGIANVSQGMCIMALIPFTKEVVLGTFNAGEYTVRFVNGDDTYQDRTFTVQ